MTGTIIVVDRQMRKAASDQFLKLGIAISINLSAVNASFVTTYNYVGIEQNVAKAVSVNGLTYALIQFFDGELAAYSGEENIRNEVILNAIESRAFENKDSLVRYLNFGDSNFEICELSSPIIIRGKQWATVRVGLSLENVHATIVSTRKALFILGLIALVVGCLASVLFASKITRPVASLVNDVEAVSKGSRGGFRGLQCRGRISWTCPLDRRVENRCSPTRAIDASWCRGLEASLDTKPPMWYISEEVGASRWVPTLCSSDACGPIV